MNPFQIDRERSVAIQTGKIISGKRWLCDCSDHVLADAFVQIINRVNGPDTCSRVDDNVLICRDGIQNEAAKTRLQTLFRCMNTFTEHSAESKDILLSYLPTDKRETYSKAPTGEALWRLFAGANPYDAVLPKTFVHLDHPSEYSDYLLSFSPVKEGDVYRGNRIPEDITQRRAVRLVNLLNERNPSDNPNEKRFFIDEHSICCRVTESDFRNKYHLLESTLLYEKPMSAHTKVENMLPWRIQNAFAYAALMGMERCDSQADAVLHNLLWIGLTGTDPRKYDDDRSPEEKEWLSSPLEPRRTVTAGEYTADEDTLTIDRSLGEENNIGIVRKGLVTGLGEGKTIPVGDSAPNGMRYLTYMLEEAGTVFANLVNQVNGPRTCVCVPSVAYEPLVDVFVCAAGTGNTRTLYQLAYIADEINTEAMIRVSDEARENHQKQKDSLDEEER